MSSIVGNFMLSERENLFYFCEQVFVSFSA